MPLSRWSSRHKKTFNKKKKEKWDGNFRLPPKPDSYYTETKGSCRWCSKAILNEDCDRNSTGWDNPGMEKWAPRSYIEAFFDNPSDPEKYNPKSH